MEPTPTVGSQDEPAAGVGEATVGVEGGAPRLGPPRWFKVLRPIVLVVVGLLTVRIIVGLVQSVDWPQVYSALGQLSWQQVPPLLALLLIRQSFNAIPLTRFVPGLSWHRSLKNDLSANLVGFVAPPPGDVVLRASMFRSWGIPPVDGMAGVTLNSLTFYVIRFSVPALGFLLLFGEELTAERLWLAVASLAVAAAIVGALVIIARGERWAWLLGWRAGRMARRFRRSVEPDQWAQTVTSFRHRMSTRLMDGLAPSLLALAAMVITDGLIVVLSLRFLGVDSDQLPLLWILGPFLIAYPLTALPMAGLGLLDAALITAYIGVAGSGAESQIVAALVVWRLITLVGTLILGVIAVSWWRWLSARGPTTIDEVA